jgi:hypothetical protein
MFCFCKELGVVKGLSTSVCRAWARNDILKTFFSFIASFIVSIVNYLLKITLKSLARFERYKTISGMNKSIVKKLFLAMTLNMTVLVFALNVNLQKVSFIRTMT